MMWIIDNGNHHTIGLAVKCSISWVSAVSSYGRFWCFCKVLKLWYPPPSLPLRWWHDGAIATVSYIWEYKNFTTNTGEYVSLESKSSVECIRPNSAKKSYIPHIKARCINAPRAHILSFNPLRQTKYIRKYKRSSLTKHIILLCSYKIVIAQKMDALVRLLRDM